MKKIMLSAAVATAALVALPAATASAEGFYAGAGYTHYDTDSGDLGGVTGRLGYRFHPNFAVEGEATASVEDDDFVELEHAYGGYVLGILPAGPVDLHARVGYQEAEFDIATGADVDADGLGYGVGATWNVTPSFGIRADYTRLEGDFDTDTFGLGGVVNF